MRAGTMSIFADIVFMVPNMTRQRVEWAFSQYLLTWKEWILGAIKGTWKKNKCRKYEDLMEPKARA